MTLTACQSIPDHYPPRFDVAKSPANPKIQALLRRRFGPPKQPAELKHWPFKKANLLRGQRLFLSDCAKCHGPVGDGDGLIVDGRDSPRNLSFGRFKYSSTGAWPTRSDLARTIRRGLPETRMPAFPELADKDLDSLIDWVQFIALRGLTEGLLQAAAEDQETLTDELTDESLSIVTKRLQSAKVIEPKTDFPKSSMVWVARGRSLFQSERGQCAGCHGLNGRGDGPRWKTLKDDWGQDIELLDLAEGVFRGGSRPQDLYRRIAGGIPGTPMPAMGKSLKAEEIWAIVHFVKSLKE